MRKIPAILTTFALAGLGTLIPGTTAQAAVSCSDNYTAALSGYMYAYDGNNCIGELGKTSSWDSDWGNSSGPFQSYRTNKASSILNKGNNYEVQFFNGTGQDWAGGHICLSRNEAYASSLADNYFHNNVLANNAISSHRWVSAGTCEEWAT